MNKKSMRDRFKASFYSLKTLISKHPSYLVVQLIDLVASIVRTIIPIDLSGRIIEIFQSGGGFDEVVKVSIKYIVILIIFTSILTRYAFLRCGVKELSL